VILIRPAMEKLFRAQITGARFFSVYCHGY
jgi:hypothetical protein